MEIVNQEALKLETPGIFSFFFDKNDKRRYIGSSGTMGIRMKAHINALLHETHPNWKIQEAFDKAQTLHLEVIQHLSNEDGIYKIQEHYIEKYNACHHGLNLSPEGRSKHYSDRWKDAMRFALKHTLLKPRRWTQIINDGIFADFDATILQQVFAKNDFFIIDGSCFHVFHLMQIEQEKERKNK